MALSTMFSYQKLRKNQAEMEGGGGGGEEEEEVVYGMRSSGWGRLSTVKRSYSYNISRRRWWRRRPRVRIPGLRRLLRKKTRLVKAAVRKVVNRYKEGMSQFQFGDLFAGNYVFMQVNPCPPVGYLEKSFMAGKENNRHPASSSQSSRYYLPWVA